MSLNEDLTEYFETSFKQSVKDCAADVIENADAELIDELVDMLPLEKIFNDLVEIFSIKYDSEGYRAAAENVFAEYFDESHDQLYVKAVMGSILKCINILVEEPVKKPAKKPTKKPKIATLKLPKSLHLKADEMSKGLSLEDMVLNQAKKLTPDVEHDIETIRKVVCDPTLVITAMFTKETPSHLTEMEASYLKIILDITKEATDSFIAEHPEEKDRFDDFAKELQQK